MRYSHHTSNLFLYLVCTFNGCLLYKYTRIGQIWARMLPLALQHLRKVADPTHVWNQCHLSRRSAVLALLIGKGPDFSTLLTIRSPHMSYGGDAAFPGGKADSMDESIWDVSLREAQEEINLDPKIVTPVSLMPGYLSSRQLLVVPTVGWVPESPMLGKSDGPEVYKTFETKLSNFLPPTSGDLCDFQLLASNKRVGDPTHDQVWGLTAHILIDLARLVYGKEPEFQFYRGKQLVTQKGSEIGNMSHLERMVRRGSLQAPRQRPAPTAAPAAPTASTTHAQPVK